MSLRTTWMDDILETKSDEWIDGYIFANHNNVTLFFRGGWDKVYDHDNGWIFVCETEMFE